MVRKAIGVEKLIILSEQIKKYYDMAQRASSQGPKDTDGTPLYRWWLVKYEDLQSPSEFSNLAFCEE